MPSRKMSLKDLKEPKRLYPNTTLVEEGKAVSAIVRPGDARYAGLAEQVQARLRELSGAKVSIVTDEEAGGKVPKANLILLGNLNTNRAVFRLYGYNYTAADDLYPGRGGYLVQTIHDPWGNGRNAVGLFGSDLDGVKTAVGRFLDGLKGGRTVSVGRLFDVKFGTEALRIPKLLDDPDIPAEMAGAEEALRRGEHTGLWGRIGEKGLLYGLTGKEGYADLYRRLVYRMYEYAMSKPDNYGGIWGFDADFALHRVMPGWDLVEESPTLYDADRLRITRILFEFITACVPHVGDMDAPRVRHNHTTFAALALHYCGVYFHKYYNAKEADDWLALSDKCFKYQAKAFKPHEDCSGYQWLTHYHLVKYSLSTGDMTYFENGNARRDADYALLTTDNLGYALPYGDNASPFGWWSELPFLRAVVCLTGDGRYQWMLDKKTAVEPRWAAYEYHRRADPVEPGDLSGTQVFPVDPLYYASSEGEKHLPLKKTFDKVVFRDGYDPQGQYLFLDGLSNGGHKHYDGNSISRITENRRIWLADCDYIKSLPKFHNGVLIFKDGQSASIPPFAELERVADFDRSGFSETTLRSYSGVDWRRNILWNRGRYFLVVDEMEAMAPGDYAFRCIWQTLGDVKVREGGLAVEQDGERFFIKGLAGPTLKLTDDPVTGENWAAYPHAAPVVRILQQIADVRLEKGQVYAYFNVLYCSDREQPQNLKMERLTDGAVRITGGEEVAFAGVGRPDALQKIPSGPAVAAAQFHATPSGFALVDGTTLSWGRLVFRSDAPVSVEYDVSRGQGVIIVPRAARVSLASDGRKGITVDRERTQARSSGGVLTFSVAKGRHRIALASDGVSGLRRTGAGKARPSVTPLTPIRRRGGRVPALKEVWAYRDKGAFLSACAADLDGDGRAEVVAGGQGVCAVKDGRALWRFGTGGEVRSVWAADLEKDGRPEVIAGSADTHVYVLDAAGAERWRFAIPFYFQTPVVRSVFTGDLNGDGLLEVVAAVESWRYYAFTHDGRELWHQMTVRPSSTGCAADLDGDGKAEVIAGTDYHRWHCIDGGGAIRWSYHPATGPRTNSAAAGDMDGDGLKEAAFAGADGNIHLLGVDGKLRWQYNTGDEVTQVAMADLDGDGLDEVVASSMSFNVYVVKGDGKSRLWRADLGEVVTCIAVGDFNGDGRPEVAAGGEDGVVRVLANGDGREVGQFAAGGAILTLSAADLDGDSVLEVIAADENGKIHALKM